MRNSCTFKLSCIFAAKLHIMIEVLLTAGNLWFFEKGISSSQKLVKLTIPEATSLSDLENLDLSKPRSN